MSTPVHLACTSFGQNRLARAPSDMSLSTRLCRAAVLALIVSCASQAAAQGIRERDGLDIWSIELGSDVESVPPSAFIQLACGTNGGPPSVPLESFVDFETCPVEKT